MKVHGYSSNESEAHSQLVSERSFRMNLKFVLHQVVEVENMGKTQLGEIIFIVDTCFF